MLSCIQLSEQNLNVFANSLSDIKNSSNDSFGCCILCQKLRCSTVSFKCPSTYLCIVSIICIASFILASLSLRFCTIATVSLERHSVNTHTCLAVSLLPSPKRLQYASHYVCQASKSVPLLTWRLSFRRSFC